MNASFCLARKLLCVRHVSAAKRCLRASQSCRYLVTYDDHAWAKLITVEQASKICYTACHICRGGEMVDALVLGTSGAIRGGSSPLPGTKRKSSIHHRAFSFGLRTRKGCQLFFKRATTWTESVRFVSSPRHRIVFPARRAQQVKGFCKDEFEFGTTEIL